MLQLPSRKPDTAVRPPSGRHPVLNYVLGSIGFLSKEDGNTTCKGFRLKKKKKSSDSPCSKQSHRLKGSKGGEADAVNIKGGHSSVVDEVIPRYNFIKCVWDPSGGESDIIGINGHYN